MSDVPEPPRSDAWRLPPWMDPTFLITISTIRKSTIVLGLGATGVLAPGDPLRWGIMFIQQRIGGGDIEIGPWSDPDTFSLSTNSLAPKAPFTIFNYGPCVTEQWWGTTSNGARLRVVEFVLF